MTEQINASSEKMGAGGMPLTRKSESLWQDAFRRLLRNRAAVLGGSIIIILLLTAIFAPLIAPRSFDEQVLIKQNTAPAWILKVFPNMKPYVKIDNAFPLGADYVGRDIFSRIVYGARVS